MLSNFQIFYSLILCCSVKPFSFFNLNFNYVLTIDAEHQSTPVPPCCHSTQHTPSCLSSSLPSRFTLPLNQSANSYGLTLVDASSRSIFFECQITLSAAPGGAISRTAEVLPAISFSSKSFFRVFTSFLYPFVFGI